MSLETSARRQPAPSSDSKSLRAWEEGRRVLSSSLLAGGLSPLTRASGGDRSWGGPEDTSCCCFPASAASREEDGTELFPSPFPDCRGS